MSKTNDYWRKREEDALRHYISEERKYDKELKKIYADMLAECRAEIDRFYGKYAAAEKITITVSIEEFKGVRLKLAYTMKNSEGQTVCQAHSEHCFLDASGNLIRLKKEYPEFYEALCGYAGSAPA